MLAGKYRVEKVLGFGGMGVVVSAFRTDLEQRVARIRVDSHAAFRRLRHFTRISVGTPGPCCERAHTNLRDASRKFTRRSV